MADTTEIPVGGLEATEPVVAGTGAIKDPGLTIGGLKGVKLAPDDSATIREKLQEMIDAREAQKGGFDAWLSHMQSYGGKPGDFLENRRNYEADVAKREGELFGMRTQLAQLNTAERLAQQKAVEDQQFYQGLQTMAGIQPQPKPAAGGLPGAAPAPTAPTAGGLPGAAPAPAPTAGPAPIMNPQQAATLASLYRADPVAAKKELWKMQAATEADKDARSIGLRQGSPEYNQYVFARTAPEALKPVQLPNPKTGFVETRPGFAVAGDILGGGRAPTPAPAAPAPGGAPAAPTPAAGGAPAPVTPSAPGLAGAGALPPEQAAQVRMDQEKARVAAEQAKQTELAKSEAAAEQALATAAANAPSDFIMSARIEQNVKKYPTLAGKLAQPTIASAIGNAVQQGLKTPYGSIGIDSINDIATQLDPEAAKIKNPAEREARMTAARELAQDFATMALRGSKMIQGQGAVSDNERNLIKLSVGDISRLTPTNVVKIAKVLECEATNAQERNALWTTMERKGTSWKDYLRSPEYNNMLEKQYYETAKALRISNPPKFNPAYEGRYSPTTVVPVPVGENTKQPAVSAARQALIDQLKK